MQKKYLYLLLLSVFGLAHGLQAQNARQAAFTVSGYVTDSKSSETLINASVYDANTMKGSVSNDFGFYTLRLPAGAVNMKASYVGYAPFEASFALHADTVINIRLKPSTELGEVTVVGKAIESNVTGTQMSTIDIPIMQIKKIPAIFGEVDVIKTLQLLPGVQSGTEGAAGMYVRGGGPDENLILLDGVPLYNVNHAMGFFSAFNADAVKNVTLYKGNFPARFGGRLSSVVDVRTKDGDMQEYHGNVSVGLIAAKLNVEGPIVKNKTSFNLSFRRTYYDLFTAPLISAIYKMDMGDGSKAWAGYYFYDFNLKLNHKFSDKDRLFLSLYSGDDKVYARIKFKEDVEYDNGSSMHNAETIDGDWHWGNRVAALRWNHVVSPKLFMNLTGTYTQYRHILNVGYGSDYTMVESDGFVNSSSDQLNLDLNSGIYDGALKLDFDYKPHENHDVKFGADATYHTYDPSSTALHFKEVYDMTGTIAIDSVVANAKIRALETNLYAEDNWNVNNFLKINLGLHYSTFTVDGQTYHSLQPRVSLRALANERLSFKAGYAAMSQYVHLLSSNTISLPTDLWVPATGKIIPMQAHQVAVGAFYNWKDFEFSVEGYYKHMKNVVEYKDGASFFSLDATDWQDKVVMGDGYSYGIELFAQRTIGNVTGWIGYTWAHANRLFDRPGQEVNFGEMFPAKYDRRHDFNVVVSYEPIKDLEVSLTWVYSSGNCATLAMQNYHSYPIYGWFENLGYITYRNNYRFNSYQRLDVGLNWHKQKKHGERTWSLNIYNALNHNNPFVVYPETESYYNMATEQTITYTKLKQVCIFPIMPSLSYSFKF